MLTESGRGAVIQRTSVILALACSPYIAGCDAKDGRQRSLARSTASAAAPVADAQRDCEGEQVAALAAQFHLDGGLTCDRRRCLAELSAAEAQTLITGATLPRGGPAVCADVNAQTDSKGGYAAYADPCCDWGGSSCTRSFGWAISERARKLCISR
ncbi:MAG TPA: hypothetical protein VGH28_05930 [Polyangiaceae bacterium]